MRAVGRRSASRYVGVHRREASWYTYIRGGKGKVQYVGRFPTEEAAAEAYDRAALYLRGPSARRNFPHRRLSPASPEQMREAVRRVTKASKTSRYWGVYFVSRHEGRGRPWSAEIRPGRRLGCWASERDAAVAHDRAALFYFGPDARLNFPDRRGSLVPADAATLRSEAWQRGKEDLTSRFLGVGWHGQSKRWQARITVGEDVIRLGMFITEEAAAEAYDRAALHFRGPSARRNFPDRRLTPTAPERIREEAHRAIKASKTSRYRGVHFVPSNVERQWMAAMTSGRELGLWATEREAAVAYDRAALFYMGRRAKLNCPDRRSLSPADAATLRWEAWWKVKQSRTSRFLGVSWHRQAQRWRAAITVREKRVSLGLFVDEEAAAHAYDDAAFAARGRRAKLNFHPRTGEPLHGRRADGR